MRVWAGQLRAKRHAEVGPVPSEWLSCILVAIWRENETRSSALRTLRKATESSLYCREIAGGRDGTRRSVQFPNPGRWTK